MILVRCWKEEEEDTHLKLLVDSLLKVYHDLDKDNDVRTSSRKVLQMLQRDAVSRVEQVAESQRSFLIWPWSKQRNTVICC